MDIVVKFVIDHPLNTVVDFTLTMKYYYLIFFIYINMYIYIHISRGIFCKNVSFLCLAIRCMNVSQTIHRLNLNRRNMTWKLNLAKHSEHFFNRRVLHLCHVVYVMLCMDFTVCCLGTKYSCFSNSCHANYYKELWGKWCNLFLTISSQKPWSFHVNAWSTI